MHLVKNVGFKGTCTAWLGFIGLRVNKIRIKCRTVKPAYNVNVCNVSYRSISDKLSFIDLIRLISGSVVNPDKRLTKGFKIVPSFDIK